MSISDTKARDADLPKYSLQELPTLESIAQYRKSLIDKTYGEFREEVLKRMMKITQSLDENAIYTRFYVTLDKKWFKEQVTYYCNRFNNEKLTDLEVSIEEDQNGKLKCVIDVNSIVLEV